MSKRDIQTVCTLAAHLAIRLGRMDERSWPNNAKNAAADAMALQRLARNIRSKAKHIETVPWGSYLVRMGEKTQVILRPYGLCAELWKDGITILGLPGNTGGDQEGFGI